MHDDDGLLVPLLRRMINLEQLQLYLSNMEDFLFGVTQLNQFTFDIKTEVKNYSWIILPANENIQDSFLGNSFSVAKWSFWSIIFNHRSGCCSGEDLGELWACFLPLATGFVGSWTDFNQICVKFKSQVWATCILAYFQYLFIVLIFPIQTPQFKHRKMNFTTAKSRVLIHIRTFILITFLAKQNNEYLDIKQK